MTLSRQASPRTHSRQPLQISFEFMSGEGRAIGPLDREPPNGRCRESRFHSFESCLAPLDSFAEALLPQSIPHDGQRRKRQERRLGATRRDRSRHHSSLRSRVHGGREGPHDRLVRHSLEQWSDEGRRSPGWVQKPLACDFIAYAFALPAEGAICYPWRLYSAPGGRTGGTGSAAMANAVG